MKLELDDKWKWAAKDCNDNWLLCQEKPEILADVWCIKQKRYIMVSDLFGDLPSCNWQDSLHQIINGELIKHVELKVDDKVMVRQRKDSFWLRRRFHSFADNRKIMCFSDGRDSWSAKNCGDVYLREYHEWRLPTPEEL